MLNHTHKHFIPPSKERLKFHFGRDISQGARCFWRQRRNFVALRLNFKVELLRAIQELSNTTIPGYRPPSARLLERTPLVGSCVWLRGRLMQQHPLGQSSALWKATIAQRWLARPLFMQQYATARFKGKEQDVQKIWRAPTCSRGMLGRNLFCVQIAF